MNAKSNAWLSRLTISLLVGIVMLLVVAVLLHRAFGATNEVYTAKPAPAFSIRVPPRGPVVKLADFKGKALIVCFLAAGDKHSQDQMPILDSLLKEFGETNLAVLCVAFEQPGAAPIQNYADSQGFNLPFYPADYDTVQAFGGLTTVPTLFVIDKNQNIIQKYVEVTQTNILRADLKAVLKQ